MREDFYVSIPEHLSEADDVLRRYGRWCAMRGTVARCGSAERDYSPPMRGFDARRDPREPLMPALEVVRAQRAFISVPERERVVLGVLYVPRRQPMWQQLRLLRLSPKTCRERHAAGLRMFWNLWRLRGSAEMAQSAPS